jgi:hypothetical protein
MAMLFSGVLDDEAGADIRLDDETAELLAPLFELRQTPQGRYLVGERRTVVR